MSKPARNKVSQSHLFKATKLKSISSDSARLGVEAETMASNFLIDQGMKLKQRNYRTRRGEIDLIMESADCLVFVEVKYRKNNRYGTSAESITSKKCQKIISAAKEYLVTYGYSENTYIRFDAVLITSNDRPQSDCTISWIQNILT